MRSRLFRGKAEEKPDGITVGKYGIGTGVALDAQMFFEEVLDQFLERDEESFGRLHDSTSSSALVNSENRTEACSSNTALAVR